MDADVERALRVLAADGLVAFPTETIWGIAARADSARAVDALRAWKGDADERPFSVMVSGVARLDALGAELGARARALASQYWPGPLTLIVRCSLALAPGVAGAGRAIGFRCSPHPVAAALAEAAERSGLGPLTATSLNESGQPPGETRQQAERILAERPGIELLMHGEAGGSDASTVVDASGPELAVVREGAIPSEELGIEAGTEPA
jgi:L-threonylcarbamoyladenylate synthase